MELTIGLVVITMTMIFILVVIRRLAHLGDKKDKTVTVEEEIVTQELSDVQGDENVEEEKVFLPKNVELKPDTTRCPRCGKPALRDYICGACGYGRDIK